MDTVNLDTGSMDIIRTSVNSVEPIRFLALGDSYTIGERVTEQQRWPVQLVDSLRSKGKDVEVLKIIAQTGWTTDELKQGIERMDPGNEPYDLVSLLIGVNNQYRGYPIETYRKEFAELLFQAIEFAGGKKQRVFVLSIPDYGVTPFGLSDQERIGKEIDLYNSINKEIALSNQVQYFNITPVSRQALNDSSFIAKDGLHPSGIMYEKWVDQISPWVVGLFSIF